MSQPNVFGIGAEQEEAIMNAYEYAQRVNAEVQQQQEDREADTVQPQAMTSAADLLRKAAQIVAGDRNAQHGPKERNHANIARFWNAWMHGRLAPGEEFDAHDVATMMECLKVARRKSGLCNPDDYVDGAGYAGVAGEIALNGKEV